MLTSKERKDLKIKYIRAHLELFGYFPPTMPHFSTLNTAIQSLHILSIERSIK